jgi:hypothetical protein
MGYYSTIKKNEMMSFAGKWIELDGDYHVEQGKPKSERQISYAFTHIQNIDLKKMT